MNDLQAGIRTTAFAFRGYNVTNLGRSGELLEHPKYGATVDAYLREASLACSETLERPVDLVTRVRQRQETTLETYGEAIGLIIAMELAQLELLERFFAVPYREGQLAFGYSLGEIAALAAGGVLGLREALRVPLAMATDCARLADDVTLGILFSLGPVLDLQVIKRLCQELNLEGQGVLGITAYLSPNSLLLMGQGDTVERFGKRMYDVLPAKIHLRRNQHRWPPMHTPIVWEANVSNRAGRMMHVLPLAMQAPTPPVISLVTGKTSYNEANARELLVQWIDQPQRLWDAVYSTLASRVTTVVHVGPEPNLVPATFKRLTDNVTEQLAARTIGGMGLRAVSRAARRPWLARMLPSKSALLRAPLVRHVILEDWLLANADSALA